MDVNPWKLPGFMYIKTTPKHISKQIASAHGCLLGIDFVPTTLWMYTVLKCKVAWHFNTYKYQNESMEMNITKEARHCNQPTHTLSTNLSLPVDS